MKRIPLLFALLFLLISSCDQSAREDYAGWSIYTGPEDRFSVRYLAPPWVICTGTDFEADCHECPAHLLGAAVCGGSSRFVTLWVPPRLLDPEFILISPYKLEITWFAYVQPPLTVANLERTAMARASFEILTEPREVTLHDGSEAAEVAYHGPMHVVVGEPAVNRPDERDFRVYYVSDGTWMYRVAIDSGINPDLPEVRQMLESFTLDPEIEGGSE